MIRGPGYCWKWVGLRQMTQIKMIFRIVKRQTASRIPVLFQVPTSPLSFFMTQDLFFDCDGKEASGLEEHTWLNTEGLYWDLRVGERGHAGAKDLCPVSPLTQIPWGWDLALWSGDEDTAFLVIWAPKEKPNTGSLTEQSARREADGRWLVPVFRASSELCLGFCLIEADSQALRVTWKYLYHEGWISTQIEKSNFQEMESHRKRKTTSKNHTKPKQKTISNILSELSKYKESIK